MWAARCRMMFWELTVPEPQLVPALSPPPLELGDRLSRGEFERRYHAMPHLRKAELLRGNVYMPSPVRVHLHAEPHADLMGWLFTYKVATPGVHAADNATVRLGPEDEPQPDALLRIAHERGGQATVDADGYLCGAPELAVEIASSSVSYDLHVKRDVYGEHGVREYRVWRVGDGAIDWFVLRGDQYQALAAKADGSFRSEVFPGLWLDAAALVSGNGARVLEVLRQGLASPEHALFVTQLAGS